MSEVMKYVFWRPSPNIAFSDVLYITTPQCPDI